MERDREREREREEFDSIFPYDSGNAPQRQPRVQVPATLQKVTRVATSEGPYHVQRLFLTNTPN